MSEYHQLHEKARTTVEGTESIAIDAFRPEEWPVVGGNIDTTKYPVKYLSSKVASSASVSKENAQVLVTLDLLQNIGETIESVEIGYAWNADNVQIQKDKELRTYILTNAKMLNENDKWYEPFASAEEVLETFMESEVYLMSDQYTSDFFSDFTTQTLAPHAYKSKLQELKITEPFVKGIKFRTSAEATLAAELPLAVEAGKYPVSMFVQWRGNDTDEFLLEAFYPFIDKGNHTPLESITTNDGDELDYEKNIFFQLPFNGTTGFEDGRQGYGAGLGYRDNDTIVQVSGNPYVPYSYTEISDLAELASFVSGTAQPTTLEVTDGAITFAPSLPLGIKAQVGNAQGLPVLQYEIRNPAANQSISLPASPVLWNDCTSTTGSLVPVQNSNACNTARPLATSQLLSGSKIGSESFYTGLVLVPTLSTIKTHYLDLACANSAAIVLGPDGVQHTVDNSPDAQIDSIVLSKGGTKVTEVKTLKQMLDQIYKKDACAFMGEDTFSVIWDTTSTNVLPENLRCSATPLSGS